PSALIIAALSRTHWTALRTWTSVNGGTVRFIVTDSDWYTGSEWNPGLPTFWATTVAGGVSENDPSRSPLETLLKISETFGSTVIWKPFMKAGGLPGTRT